MDDLDKVKILIGLDIEDEQALDAFITLQLERAENLIRNSTLTPEKYEYLKVDAVVFAFNQQGYEGQLSGGTMGINATWDSTSMDRYIKERMPAQYTIV